MAHIYIGDRSKADGEVMRRFSDLNDDFHIFGEFTCERIQADWLVCRAASNERPHSTVTLMELKRTARPLRGQTFDIWHARGDDGTWEEITPSNQQNTNYFLQALNTANAIRGWMYNNQRLYLDPTRDRPEADFRVWPDLVILSPEGVVHQLPYKPQNTKFGTWHFQLEPWIARTLDYVAPVGQGYSAADLRRLGEALGLTKVWPPAPAAKQPADDEDVGETADLAAYFSKLHRRLATLERRLVALESGA